MGNPFTDPGQREVYALFADPLTKVPYPGRNELERAYHDGAAARAYAECPYSSANTFAAWFAGRDRAQAEREKPAKAPLSPEAAAEQILALVREFIPADRHASLIIYSDGMATLVGGSGSMRIAGGWNSPLAETLRDAHRDPVAEGWATLGLSEDGTRIVETADVR